MPKYFLYRVTDKTREKGCPSQSHVGREDKNNELKKWREKFKLSFSSVYSHDSLKVERLQEKTKDGMEFYEYSQCVKFGKCVSALSEFQQRLHQTRGKGP